VLEILRGKLPDVKDVRLSSRLKESAAVLVADEHAPSAHFERLMKRAGRDKDLPHSKRILELNPEHPAVQALKSLHAKDAADERLETFGRLLYDQAVVAEGSKIEDVTGFARRLNDLLVKAAT
jgi:molecular chaperone HtpG